MTIDPQTIDPQTTAAEICEAWGITTDDLEQLLGPRPCGSKRPPRGVGTRIIRFLRYRSSPVPAATLARAVRGGTFTRQAVYSAAAKLVAKGLVRRTKHGHYQIARADR